jgi:hypothetical protein
VQLGASNANGISYPGTNILNFITNSTAALTIDASQRVGIGTNAPSEKLDILDGSISVGSSTNTNTTNTLIAGYGYILSGTKYGNTSIRSTYANSNNSAGLEFYVGASGTNTAEALRITSAGLVGIGTSAPVTLFHVSGGRTTLSSSDGYELAFARTANYFYWYNDGGNINGKLSLTTTAGAGGGEIITFTQDTKQVGIGTASPSSRLHVSQNSAGTTAFINISGDDGTNDGGAGVNFRYNETVKWSLFTRRYSSANKLYISTGEGDANSSKVTITEGGLVGIGTTSPASVLNIVGTTTFNNTQVSGGYNTLQIIPATTIGSSVNRISTINTTGLSFETGGSERARIDTSGRLLVGTSTARAVGVTGPSEAPLQIETPDSLICGLALIQNRVDSYGPNLRFGKTGGTTVGSVTAVSEGHELGTIQFCGADGTDLTSVGALIRAQVDGTPGNDDMPGRLVFSTTADGASSPTERLRIDSSGRVGIGKTSLNSTFEIYHATEPYIYLQNSTSGAAASDGLSITLFGSDAYFNNRENGAMLFYNNGSERARIDSSGRLLVGTSTARSTTGFGAPRLQLVGNYESSILLTSNENNTNSIGLVLSKIRGTSIVQNNDPLGYIAFAGYDGSIDRAGAFIQANVDGAPGDGDMPTRLVFSTTADGASATTERMRISNGGNIYANTTADPVGPSNVIIHAARSSGNAIGATIDTAGYTCYTVSSVTNGYAMWMYNTTASANVGSILINTASVSYTTTSDYRLKENVTPVSDGISRLQQLKPSRFNFIADPSETVDGFIAHEVQTVVPEAITGTKDAVDDDGNPIYQGIDQSKLVPLLTAALQEAVAKIESLEARLTAAGI